MLWHEGGRHFAVAAGGNLLPLDQFRQAEIENLGVAALGHEDIRWL
jgi:hypothetical protein